ncbi:MAG: hypothetical protein E5299_02362 [Burkholderia gladioli]|nr:MAG: hypothetical protein E5299_02362 [Burkholderia gladioli]
MSRVTNRSQVRWKVFEGAMNADILLDFLKRLIKEMRSKRRCCINRARSVDVYAQRISLDLCNNAYGGPRSSAIRSYCLKLCPSMLLHPHTRFMQQRPLSCNNALPVRCQAELDQAASGKGLA